MVSIIIPVYNTAQYLTDCINSVLLQDVDDFEIILIDDGSTDISGVMCDQYAKQYKTVRTIHQKNSGLSAARNTGIEIARGEYITFVDSDDMLAGGFINRALELAKMYEADLVAFSNVRCEADEKWSIEYSKTKKIQVYVYDDRVQKMKKFLIGAEIGTMACAKLYRKELFEKIRYPSGKLHEDVFTTYKVVDEASRIVTTSQIGYIYRKSPNSITTKAFSERRLDSVEAKKTQLSFIRENYPSLQKEAETGVIYACNQCMMLMARSRYNNKVVMNEFQRLYRDYGKSYLSSPVSIKGKVLACLAILDVRLVYFILRNIHLLHLKM